MPEQLVPYVRAVSDLEPLECGGFLAWRSGPALVLVGHDAGLKQGGAEQEPRLPPAFRPGIQIVSPPPDYLEAIFLFF
mgnify:CR=1 FL=1